jgi:hypothetical protein
VARGGGKVMSGGGAQLEEATWCSAACSVSFTGIPEARHRGGTGCGGPVDAIHDDWVVDGNA